MEQSPALNNNRLKNFSRQEVQEFLSKPTPIDYSYFGECFYLKPTIAQIFYRSKDGSVDYVLMELKPRQKMHLVTDAIPKLPGEYVKADIYVKVTDWPFVTTLGNDYVVSHTPERGFFEAERAA